MKRFDLLAQNLWGSCSICQLRGLRFAFSIGKGIKRLINQGISKVANARVIVKGKFESFQRRAAATRITNWYYNLFIAATALDDIDARPKIDTL